MAKDIAYREENRRKIQAGVNLSADVVRFTLGPSGRNVLLERKDTSPLETNNGYEILKEIKLEEQAENLGVQLIREAAAKYDGSGVGPDYDSGRLPEYCGRSQSCGNSKRDAAGGSTGSCCNTKIIQAGGES